MSNKMALDALTAALAAMEHMANVLNNIDAVDEDEDAQHDAAFEAVRAAIAELEQPKKSRIVAASMDYYPESDQRFFNFWYGHMFEDLMQPPLVGIDHATARYIWNAAAIAALQAEPQSQINTMRLDAPILDGFPIPVYWEYLHDGRWRPELYFNGKYAKGARGLYSDLQMHAMAQASARYLLAVDEFDHACHVDGDTPGGAPEQYDEAEGRLKAARAVLESAIKGFSA